MRALSLLVVNDVPASLPPRASTLPRKPYARNSLYFHHGLLTRDIGLLCLLQTKDDAFCIGRRTYGDTGDLER
jgi:hypothetical protein